MVILASNDSDEERSYGSEERAPKRSKTDIEVAEETLDRFSALPDSLILHILSLLPMHEVFKTCNLSKSLQYLWPCVPNLIFTTHHNPSTNRFQRFVSFVNRTLILRTCTKINKFAIHFDHDYPHDLDIDKWIRFAAKSSVEDLDLNFIGPENMGRHNSYMLPQQLYTSSSLTKLKLTSCFVEPSGVISWGSLKSLSFDFVDLSDDVIERIVSGCPVLEVLEFNNFCGFRRLDISSLNFKTLKLRNFWYYRDHIYEDDDDDLLEISAPNLQSFEISGFFHRLKCRLVNVPSSLVDANLSFKLQTSTDCSDDYDELRNLLKELLESLHHVKQLTIGNWCIWVLSTLEVKGLPSPLLKCKCLTLDMHIMKWDLPGIASLLQSSP